MRLAIAGFNLESVTFLPQPTSLSDFQQCAKRGNDLLKAFKGTNTVPGGFLSACANEEIEVIPLVYSEAGAAGPSTEEAFDFFLDEITENVSKNLSAIDGLLLGLHGALVTTGGRTDLDFLTQIRNRIGNHLPIGVTFDLHGNLDSKILDSVQVASAYHESPHTDMGATGYRVAEFLIRTLRQEIYPESVLQKVPVVLPSIFTATSITPLREIMMEARKCEIENPDLLDCSVILGFAYADVPQIGVSILATANKKIEYARNAAAKLAKLVWDQRHELYPNDQVYSVEDGLIIAERIAKHAQKPVVVLEHADRMNDSTYVLQALLEHPNIKAAVPYFWDPSAAKFARNAGVGSNISIHIGGHSSEKAGGTVSFEGKVIWAGEPHFRMGGNMGRGQPVDLGPTALVKRGNLVIWLITKNLSAINLDPFEQFGLNHLDFDIVVLRSKTHFRSVWENESEKVIIVDTPDWGPASLHTLPYSRARNGVFPITLDNE